MSEPNKSKVDKMSDNLYSRTRYKSPTEQRSTVGDLESEPVEEEWQGEELDDLLARDRRPEEAHPFMKKFFMFAVLFFLATIVIASVVFFGGVNFVSSKNVDINIVGPTAISAGEILELGVTIENKNNTDLETANFSAQFPQGSRDPKDTSKGLTYSREVLGVVKAGGEEARNISVVLLGSKGETKEIKFSVEYKVKGSNATFYKDKLYQITIGNAPVTLEIRSPRSVTSGEIFETEVAITLNSTEVLKNVLVRAEYPYGYSVTESSPAAASDGSFWALGDVPPGAVKKIKIKGRLTGENQEERTFRFYIGVGESASLSPNFKNILLSNQNTIAIERPAVGLSIAFNGENTSVYTAPVGKTVQVSARFKNNMSERLLEPRLEVKFTGSALNKSTISVQNNGSYNAGTNRISWSPVNASGLAELAPGEDGQVFFSFESLSGIAPTSANQDIGLQFLLSGTPVGDLKQLSVSEIRTVKIASQVTLSARTVYSLGSFVNQGSVPPKAEQTTSYTLILTAGNTQGDISGTKVTGKLGQNVEYISAKSFASEDIVYDPQTRLVTWNLGNLSADAGFSTPKREVSFQVALTPIAGQVGTTPTLLSSITLTGQDGSTAKAISISNTALTTRMPTDPAFIQGDDVVTK